MKTHYEVLGVDKHATLDEIKMAYRRLIRQYHPDTGGYDSEKVHAINRAYETLKDPQKRHAYDETLKKSELGEQMWRFFDKAQHQFRQNVKDNFEFLKTLRTSTDTNFDDKVMVWVYPWQAMFGDKVAVRTKFHHLLVPMPAFGDRLSLTIRGAGKPKGDGDFGDLVVEFAIKIPKWDELSPAQKEAFERLRQSHKKTQV